MTNIQEGNLKIATFEFPRLDFDTGDTPILTHKEVLAISAKKNPTVSYILDHLEYEVSWDWLMPVVEKLEKCGWGIRICVTYCEVSGNDGERFWVDISGKTKIQMVWEAVVRTIEMHENSKKSAKPID